MGFWVSMAIYRCYGRLWVYIGAYGSLSVPIGVYEFLGVYGVFSKVYEYLLVSG